MLGTCPECHESIRVPEADPQQQVRCPLCAAEYSLERVIDSLPPVLELVGRTRVGLGIDIESGEGTQRMVVGGEPAESSAANRRSYQPRQRKPLNPVAEIIKVILGGVVAVPVGILCIWWFAGRAPFGVAEPVSRYVPWIVPEKFRAPDWDEDPRDESNEKQNGPDESAGRSGRSTRDPETRRQQGFRSLRLEPNRSLELESTLDNPPQQGSANESVLPDRSRPKDPPAERSNQGIRDPFDQQSAPPTDDKQPSKANQEPAKATESPDGPPANKVELKSVAPDKQQP